MGSGKYKVGVLFCPFGQVQGALVGIQASGGAAGPSTASRPVGGAPPRGRGGPYNPCTGRGPGGLGRQGESAMEEPAALTIHTDGASRGNPGDAAFAYVIARDGAPALEEAGLLGQATNNQAEYTALVRALEHALDLGPRNRLIIHSDSELLVKQMNGAYRFK